MQLQAVHTKYATIQWRPDTLKVNVTNHQTQTLRAPVERRLLLRRGNCKVHWNFGNVEILAVCCVGL